MKKMKTAAVATVAALGLAFLLAGCSENATGDDGVYWNTNVSYGTLTDIRNGSSYRTVSMPDGKTWMAENLNFAATGSWCYDDSKDNCATYGRLYNWATAKAVCPSGWHLPSIGEWSDLAFAVGHVDTKLKSKSGWTRGLEGTDDYGFSALPGGYSFIYEGELLYHGVGHYSKWWSATEKDDSNAYFKDLEQGAGLGCSGCPKETGFSVRCLRD